VFDLVVLLWFGAGLVFLAVGAELLVRGASRLAAAAGVSPLVIGLTVVAFGTSTPELAVTVDAAWRGASDLSLGNVVGSNIFNVLLILGLSAVVAPLVVASQLIRREVPVMIGVSLVVVALALDGRLGRVDGLLLTSGIVAYTYVSIRASRRETAAIRAEYGAAFGRRPARLAGDAVLVVVGLGVLVAGTEWVVGSAVAIARTLGVTELVIGLTLVAGGTSLPELATSVLAALRGQRDIAVGNIVGSNIFNILAILGVSSLIAPVTVSPAALWFDLPVMIAVALACLPIFLSGASISRAEGAAFLTAYAGYLVYLVLDATTHDALPVYRTAMLAVVLPLTVIALIEMLRRSWPPSATMPLSNAADGDRAAAPAGGQDGRS
jgi:cation:H+ antiporter